MPANLLVDTNWLAEHLNDPNVRVVDMRGYVTTRLVEPGVEEAVYRGAPEEYAVSHIPGAVYIDWTKDIVDLSDPVPAQIAPADVFAEAMASRGIGDDTTVVAVDHMGGQFATRLWWALTYYGHENVCVLDGGFNRWRDEERPVDDLVPTPARAVFTPRVRPEWRRTADQVYVTLGGGQINLIDARDEAQYGGSKRRGPRGGHIPGAISVPRELFFDPGGGFRSLPEIQAALANRGIAPDRPVTAYCNGGVAATVVLFNMARLGYPKLSNYDGSWNEWSGLFAYPVEGVPTSEA